MCSIVANRRATVVGVGSSGLDPTRLMEMTRAVALRGIESETAIARRRHISPGTEPLGACAIGLERSCGRRSAFGLSVQQPRVCR